MATINWQNAVDPLVQAKNDKMAELDRACTQTILGTFTFQFTDGNTYTFYNDMIAQSNFDKVYNCFAASLVTSMSWTAYDSNNNAVRLTFDQPTFMNLYKAHLNHIQGNISQFRDTLQPQVESATTVDAVNAITWTGVN